MMEAAKNKNKYTKLRTSTELLSIKGDGSRQAVIKSLMKKKSPVAKNGIQKLQTFKIERSSLFDQLDQFLPQMKASTSALVAKPEEEIAELNIENTEGCSKVVEMNILLGEMLGRNHLHNTDEDSETCSSEESEESSESDSDDSDKDGESENKKVITPLSFSKLKIPSNTKFNKKKNKNLITEIENPLESLSNTKINSNFITENSVTR